MKELVYLKVRTHDCDLCVAHHNLVRKGTWLSSTTLIPVSDTCWRIYRERGIKAWSERDSPALYQSLAMWIRSKCCFKLRLCRPPHWHADMHLLSQIILSSAFEPQLSMEETTGCGRVFQNLLHSWLDSIIRVHVFEKEVHLSTLLKVVFSKHIYYGNNIHKCELNVMLSDD